MSEGLDYTGGEYPIEQYKAWEFQASDEREWQAEPSPVFKMRVGEVVMNLTRDICMVYVNSRNEWLNHLYITQEGKKPFYLFQDTLGEERFEDLLGHLASADFTFEDSHEPDKACVETFVSHEMDDIDMKWRKAEEKWRDV